MFKTYFPKFINFFPQIFWQQLSQMFHSFLKKIILCFIWSYSNAYFPRIGGGGEMNCHHLHFELERAGQILGGGGR